MRCKMVKVRTASIPSRTAANQFHEKHGYDIEWVPEQCLFYIRDEEKDQLHAVHVDEVTNFTLDVSPAAFIAGLRGVTDSVKRGPGRPAKTEQA